MVRKGLLTAAAVIAAVAVGFMAPAGAADDLVIQIDYEVVRGSGTVEVARATVPADLVGDSCEATLVADNNESIHDGNNLIVSTGGESVTFTDVESEAFQETTAEGEVVLGEAVIVELQLGEDGISSGGFVLSFDCSQDVTTTTVAPTTTEVPAEVLGETQLPAAQPQVAPQPSAAAQSTSAPAPISFTG